MNSAPLQMGRALTASVDLDTTMADDELAKLETETSLQIYQPKSDIKPAIALDGNGTIDSM